MSKISEFALSLAKTNFVVRTWTGIREAFLDALDELQSFRIKLLLILLGLEAYAIYVHADGITMTALVSQATIAVSAFFMTMDKGKQSIISPTIITGQSPSKGDAVEFEVTSVKPQ